jgi:hypothetical protein
VGDEVKRRKRKHLVEQSRSSGIAGSSVGEVFSIKFEKKVTSEALGMELLSISSQTIIVCAFVNGDRGKGQAELCGQIERGDSLISINNASLENMTIDTCVIAINQASWPKTVQFRRTFISRRKAEAMFTVHTFIRRLPKSGARAASAAIAAAASAAVSRNKAANIAETAAASAGEEKQKVCQQRRASEARAAATGKHTAVMCIQCDGPAPESYA